ncbi:MAG: hypothetical protein ACFNP8_07730, partial [Alloprevotella sp.]
MSDILFVFLFAIENHRVALNSLDSLFLSPIKMSYEFIIGTLIGIAGLALTWICSKEQIKSYF